MKRLALDTIIKIEKHKRTQRALKKNDVNYNNNKINRGPVGIYRWKGRGRFLWEDHMVFRGNRQGISHRQQSMKGGQKKLTANKGQ